MIWNNIYIVSVKVTDPNCNIIKYDYLSKMIWSNVCISVLR